MQPKVRKTTSITTVKRQSVPPEEEADFDAQYTSGDIEGPEVPSEPK